jgi:type IV secretory pathway TrbD component
VSVHADGTGEARQQPVGELLKQLSQETSTLVRQELELAKAEMSVKAKEGGMGAGMLGGAGISALLMLGALTATLMGVLDTFMKFWIAALIVTVLWAVVAGVLALQGKNKLQEATPPMPEQTQDSVKEDVAWAKTRARSATK